MSDKEPELREERIPPDCDPEESLGGGLGWRQNQSSEERRPQDHSEDSGESGEQKHQPGAEDSPSEPMSAD
jgi:hypothetical protein